ncbi:MAG: tRNA lysidine(34) synthetase TilS [Bdellovibrionales bacterium]
MDRRTALNNIRGFDHRLLKSWRQHVPKDAAVLMAVSGGVDSLVMADFLWRWQRLLRLELVVAHVHHGRMRGRQGTFRNQAAKVVFDFARRRKLPFWSNTQWRGLKLVGVQSSKKRLKSEADFRDFRWDLLRQWQIKWQQTYDRPIFIATAHSADDQIETQLIRLLRGTGPDGLRAMTMRDQDLLRPLLQEPKSTLLSVAKKQRLKWKEDPSNHEGEQLRSWLRQNWLGPLRSKWPEALPTMARSLVQLLEAVPPRPRLKVDSKKRLGRQQLLSLSRPEQRRILAQYFRQLGLTNYSLAHLEELLRRLDTGRKEHTFKLLGHMCMITTEWIALRPE